MRALIQRVKYAKVTVNNEIVGSIGSGLCVFVGVTHTDDTEKSRKLAKKITNLRIFDDSEGVMNLSPLETSSEILVVSQFTLYGDTSRGNRPSWIAAACAFQFLISKVFSAGPFLFHAEARRRTFDSL